MCGRYYYSDKTNLRNELQRYRLEQLLKNNNSCIMDSCFSHNWKDKKSYYDGLGFKYYIIRLICSDKTISDRLSKRVRNKDNYSDANFKDYLWMKENVSHVDDSLISYTINTENDVEEQVIDFLNKYNLI